MVCSTLFQHPRIYYKYDHTKLRDNKTTRKPLKPPIPAAPLTCVAVLDGSAELEVVVVALVEELVGIALPEEIVVVALSEELVPTVELLL
jgi:hypothetical protein